MSRVILLADDSVTIQKVIELTFMDEDYQVVAVSNGDAAIDKLAETAPDIVISDVHMPGASGYDVCRHSKQRHPQVPVLLLVGTFEPFEESEAESAGADSFLKKPFDSQELLRQVEDLLGGAGQPAAAAEDPAAPAAAEPEWTPAGEASPFGPAGTLGGGEAGGEPAAAEAAFDEEDLTATGFAETEDEEDDLDDLDDWNRVEIAADEAPEPVWSDFDAGAAGVEVEEPESFEGPGTAFGEAEPDFETPAGAAAEEPAWSPEDEAAPSYGVEADAFGDEEPAPRFEEEPSSPFGERSALNAAAEPFPPAFADEEAAVPPAAEMAPEPGTAPAEVEERAGDEAEEPAAEASIVASEAAAPAAPATTGLSEEDVDRIARRVAEVIGEKAIRDIAWEVIPDLAEIIIRDRLEQLESQLESQAES